VLLGIESEGPVSGPGWTALLDGECRLRIGQVMLGVTFLRVGLGLGPVGVVLAALLELNMNFSVHVASLVLLILLFQA
jgi:hypothetical protein